MMQHAAFQKACQEEVLESLRRTPKEISSKYFYDAQGCELFEHICKLPEYYPTRTELSIMAARRDEIRDVIGPHAILIEYGSGASRKTHLLLDTLTKPRAYVPLDIAMDHLQEEAEVLRDRFPELIVLPTHGDFTQEIHLPEETPQGRRVVYFPGSTIGNLTTRQAIQLLQRIHRSIGEEGGLLLGVDLVKDTAILEAAYNDSQGVTAAFNLNAIRHINQVADADFDPDRFRHIASYDVSKQRIEMHLESLEDQSISIGDEKINIAQGERIRTELSHKYERSTLEAMCREAGLAIEQWWTDEQQWFAVAWITAKE